MELKELIGQVQTEWTEMKRVITGEASEQKTKFGTVLGDTEQKLAGFNSRLDQIEVKMQRAVRVEQSTATGDVAFQLSVEKMTRGGGMSEADAITRLQEHKAAQYKYLRKGAQNLTPAEVKLMTIGDDTTGGFGASPEFDTQILKGVILVSPIRSLFKVRSTSKRSIKVMKRTGTFAAQWVSEVGTRTETTGLTYGMEEIPTHELYAFVDISRQDLEDNDFDLEAELRGEFTEQFAYAEGVAGISGDANGKPEGLMVNAAIAADVTGDANLLTYNGLIDVSHNGKSPYLSDARWILNLKTLGALRKMVNGEGEPIWEPQVASSAPATLLGWQYTIVPAMDDVSANKYPVAFGSFNRAYVLVDRVNLELVRDDLTQAAKGVVRFYARKRLGGQVVLAEAVRKLQVHV